MAEGGEPGPKEETHAEEAFEYPTWNWDRGSLEYVFASDFIHFVMDTEDLGWRSHRLIEHRSPLTPFNTTIQKVVEEILRIDSTYLNLVFQSMSQRCGKLNQVRFNICAVFLKIKYFGPIRNSFGHLLKYFCVLGLFSAWALRQGLYTAPFFCVDIILGYLREFLVDNGFTSMDAFWFSFEQYAPDALSLPKIHMLKEEDLRSLPDLQRLTEQHFQETDVAGSSENLEPEMEILPECTEGESSGEKIASEKGESKGAKVETPSKEATGSDVESSEAQPPTDEATGSDVKSPEGQPPTDEATGSDVKSPEGQPPTDEAAVSNVKTPEAQAPKLEASDTKASEPQAPKPEASGSDTKASEPQEPKPEASGSDTKASEAQAPKPEAAGSDTKAYEAQAPKPEAAGSDTKASETQKTSDKKESKSVASSKGATKSSDKKEIKSIEPSKGATKPSDKKETKSVEPSKGETSVPHKSQGASQPSKPGVKKELSKTPSKSPGAPKQSERKTHKWK